jgi:hypothetical protein
MHYVLHILPFFFLVLGLPWCALIAALAVIVRFGTLVPLVIVYVCVISVYASTAEHQSILAAALMLCAYALLSVRSHLRVSI